MMILGVSALALSSMAGYLYSARLASYKYNVEVSYDGFSNKLSNIANYYKQALNEQIKPYEFQQKFFDEVFFCPMKGENHEECKNDSFYYTFIPPLAISIFSGALSLSPIFVKIISSNFFWQAGTLMAGFAGAQFILKDENAQKYTELNSRSAKESLDKCLAQGEKCTHEEKIYNIEYKANSDFIGLAGLLEGTINGLMNYAISCVPAYLLSKIRGKYIQDDHPILVNSLYTSYASLVFLTVLTNSRKYWNNYNEEKDDIIGALSTEIEVNQ